MTDAKAMSQISEFGDEVDGIIKNAGRPVHKRSMSEDAIKRNYLIEASDREEEDHDKNKESGDNDVPKQMEMEIFIEPKDVIRILPEIIIVILEFGVMITNTVNQKEEKSQRRSPAKKQTVSKSSTENFQLAKIVQEKPTPMNIEKTNLFQKPKLPAKNTNQLKATTTPKVLKKQPEQPEPMLQEPIKQTESKSKPKSDKIKVKIESSQQPIPASEIIGASKAAQKSGKDSKRDSVLKNDIPAQAPKVQLLKTQPSKLNFI